MEDLRKEALLERLEELYCDVINEYGSDPNVDPEDLVDGFKDKVADLIISIEDSAGSWKNVLKALAKRIEGPENNGKCNHKWEEIGKNNVYNGHDTENDLPIGVKYVFRCTKCMDIKTQKTY